MAGYTQNANGGYDINYNDERLRNVENERVQKEANIATNYDNIINNSDQYYQNQINAVNDYANTQKEMQQANTDFAIQQINQQKEQMQKDYTKEQKGAYTDYMKQKASSVRETLNSGMSSTGYSESALVSMYNSYQNRVASARDTLNRNEMEFNNQIQKATLANNEALATIAYNALQAQNQLNQQAFEYKNNLLLEKEKQLQVINDTYYARYQDVIGQINNEIQLQIALDKIDREYDQWLAEFNEKKLQRQIAQEQWEKEFALQQKQIEASRSQKTYYTSQNTNTQNPYSNVPENNNNSNNNNGNGTVKLSNGQMGYSSAKAAYQAAGGGTPYTEDGLIKNGIVKAVTYNGKTYYYVVRLPGKTSSSNTSSVKGTVINLAGINRAISQMGGGGGGAGRTIV